LSVSGYLLEEGTSLETSFKHVVYVCMWGEGWEKERDGLMCRKKEKQWWRAPFLYHTKKHENLEVEK